MIRHTREMEAVENVTNKIHFHPLVYFFGTLTMKALSDISTVNLCACSNFRAPFIEPVLNPVQNICKDNAGDREDQHTNEYFVGLERRSRNRDHEANSGRCRIKLADQNANQRPAYRDTQPC